MNSFSKTEAKRKKILSFRNPDASPPFFRNSLTINQPSYTRKNSMSEHNHCNLFTNLENNEKEEIKSLDKWVNDFQYQTHFKIDDNIERNIKQYTKQNLEIKENQMKIGPYLNQTIVNHSLYDKDYFEPEEKKSELTLKSDDILQQKEKKSGRILKNLNTIRNENNEKVISQIMFKKLDKIFPKNKEIPYILNKSKIFSQETLNGFKNLKNDFGEKYHLTSLRNNLIMEKLKNTNEKALKTLDLEKEEKILTKMRCDEKIREKFLWDGYHEIEGEIVKKKAFVNDLRKFLAELADKKKRYILDMDLILKKFESLEERFMKNQQMEKALMKKDSIAENKRIIPNLLRITKIREEREHQKSTIAEQIVKINKEMKQRNKELEEIIVRIKELRVKKLNIRLQLKELYLDIMKIDNENRENMVWILKELKKLDFLPSEDSFPKVLDEESRKYLIKFADIELEIEHLNSSHSQLLHESYPLHQDCSQKPTAYSHQLSSLEISKKIESLKSSLVNGKYIIGEDHCHTFTESSKFFTLKKIHKIFAKKQNSQEEIQEKIEENSEVSFKKETLDNLKTLLKRIDDLSLIKEEYKSKEIQRIVSLSLYDEKHSENLEKTLKILFGKKESEFIIEEFKKEKINVSQKIQSNQTYSFSSNINSNLMSNNTKPHEIPKKIIIDHNLMKETVMKSRNYFYKGNYQKLPNEKKMNNFNSYSQNLSKNSFFTTFANNSNTFHLSTKNE